MDFIVAHKFEFVAVLLAVSELLDAIPSIKASSIWKVAFNVIKSIAKK